MTRARPPAQAPSPRTHRSGGRRHGTGARGGLPLWDAVDRYLDTKLGRPDPILRQILAASARAGLPDIQVSSMQGRFLHLLARLVRARRILEVGTLGGYSTVWLGRALAPGGHLISLELEPRHAAVARANLRRAGLSGVAEVRVGPALAAFPQLERAHAGPFDLIFIDADKENGAAYLDWAVRLSHPGTLILVDNVVRKGKILDQASTESKVVGTRKFLRRFATDPRLTTTVVQWVGAKGHDGIAMAVVTDARARVVGRRASRPRRQRSARASGLSRANPG